MSYKFQEILQKFKKNLPVYIVLWVFLVVTIIAPISYAVKNANVTGKFDSNIFFQSCGEAASDIVGTIGKGFSSEYIGTYFDIALKFTVVYAIVIIIGTLRNAKSMEFRDIEHGSSDWSRGGEQYRILSNKKGIILAENNYLPLDKRGNVNVLIVGRIWCG